MRAHGSRSCYVLGCRAPECVEANRAYQREYRDGAAARTRRQAIRDKHAQERADRARGDAALASD